MCCLQCRQCQRLRYRGELSHPGAGGRWVGSGCGGPPFPSGAGPVPAGGWSELGGAGAGGRPERAGRGWWQRGPSPAPRRGRASSGGGGSAEAAALMASPG